MATDPSVPDIFQDSGVPEPELRALSSQLAAVLDQAIQEGMPANAIAGALFGMFLSALDQVKSPYLRRAAIMASLKGLQDQLVAMGNDGLIL